MTSCHYLAVLDHRTSAPLQSFQSRSAIEIGPLHIFQSRSTFAPPPAAPSTLPRACSSKGGRRIPHGTLYDKLEYKIKHCHVCIVVVCLSASSASAACFHHCTPRWFSTCSTYRPINQHTRTPLPCPESSYPPPRPPRHSILIPPLVNPPPPLLTAYLFSYLQ